MAKNLSNIHIYGDLDSGAWVAPKGTTGPDAATLAQPATPWQEVGWISEDGISEESETDSEVYRAWQGATIVRRKITANDRTFTFQALEENLAVHGLKYRGQKPVVTGGVARTTVKDQTSNDERAWVFFMVDGGVRKRFTIPAGAYEQTGTITYSNTGGPTVHEFRVTPIGDYFEDTDNPAITGVTA